MIRSFDARFAQDLDIRVQFLKVATALTAALAAADRPISEWPRALDDPAFGAFLRYEQARLGTGDTYVQTQMAELARLHALRDSRSWKLFDDETKSTRNALQAYRPGELLGEFFSGPETFDPATVVFGRNRLFVTSGTRS